MRKIMTKFLMALFGLGLMASAANASCDNLTVAEMNWKSGGVVAAVAKFLMENGYGCQVTLVPSSTLPSVTSVAETGKPDIIMELWVNAAPLYYELESQGKVKTASDIFSKGGEEGWWLPAYMVEENPELATIEGVLKNAESIGRFHNCPVGWACRVVNDNLVKAFGMRDRMDIFDHGSGETLATSIAAAYADKKPWFGYYWGPTAILGKYKMVKVDLGPHNAKVHQCNAKEDCPNPKASAYPVGIVLNVVTTDFETRNPAVSELIGNMTFNSDTVNSLLAWQENNRASAEETAVYFLTQYKDEWRHWLNSEAKEKLSALLS